MHKIQIKIEKVVEIVSLSDGLTTETQCIRLELRAETEEKVEHRSSI